MTHLHSIRRLGSCSLNEDNSGSKVCLCCNPLLGRVETLLSNGAIQTSQSIQQQYLCSAVRVLKLEAKFILAKRMKERNGGMINHIYIYIYSCDIQENGERNKLEKNCVCNWKNR